MADDKTADEKPQKLSAAKAHTLVQEFLAEEATGEGFTGSVTEDPSQKYPANLHFVIEVPISNHGGHKAASSWRYENPDDVTRARIRKDVLQAVATCRQTANQEKAKLAPDADD